MHCLLEQSSSLWGSAQLWPAAAAACDAVPVGDFECCGWGQTDASGWRDSAVPHPTGAFLPLLQLANQTPPAGVLQAHGPVALLQVQSVLVGVPLERERTGPAVPSQTLTSFYLCDTEANQGEDKAEPTDKTYYPRMHSRVPLTVNSSGAKNTVFLNLCHSGHFF